VDTRFSNLVRVGGLACFAFVAYAAPSLAGNICDLRTTTTGTCTDTSFTGTGYTAGDAKFFTDEQHPAGTGFIDSFVRIQQNGWEQGYNTSARPIETNPLMTVKTDPNYTRNLTLGEVGTKVLADGLTYREFFLDVNEPAATNGNKNWITLDQLEVFASHKGSLNDYYYATDNTLGPNSGDGLLQGGGTSKKIYDMDSAGDNFIQLDYLVKGSGSGSSDMVFYLKDSLFTGYASSDYVYLFSQFGDIKGNVSNKF